MIARVRLVLCDADLSFGALAIGELLAEFPSLEIAALRERRAPGDVTIDASDWRGPSCDFDAFDRRLAPLEQGQGTLDIRTPARSAADTAAEILTRYQRLIPRSNAASRTPLFERVAEHHRALHDLSLLPARAAYDRALDVRHWVLRLDPHAGFVPQVAALFQDDPRLSESLAEIGVDPSTRAEIARLTQARHGRRGDDHAGTSLTLGPPHGASARGLALLADADALSFFAQGSPSFVDRYGPTHARKKIAESLSRMSPRARTYLTRIRLRNDVARTLSEAIGSEPRLRVRAS
jgi:hypothetical protein